MNFDKEIVEIRLYLAKIKHIPSTGVARATQGKIYLSHIIQNTRTDGSWCCHRYGPNVMPRYAGRILPNVLSRSQQIIYIYHYDDLR